MTQKKRFNTPINDRFVTSGDDKLEKQCDGEEKATRDGNQQRKRKRLSPLWEEDSET
jgi:hypothetical protein